MSKHKEALDILIHELSDFVGAETYCVTNGQSTGVIPTAASDDNNDQPQHQIMPRSSSLAAVKEKPLPILVSERDEAYLSTEQLNERKALFTMLFKSYIAIKDR